MAVFAFEVLQAAQLAWFQSAVFSLPAIVGVLRDASLAQQVRQCLFRPLAGTLGNALQCGVFHLRVGVDSTRDSHSNHFSWRGQVNQARLNKFGIEGTEEATGEPGYHLPPENCRLKQQSDNRVPNINYKNGLTIETRYSIERCNPNDKESENAIWVTMSRNTNIVFKGLFRRLKTMFNRYSQ